MADQDPEMYVITQLAKFRQRDDIIMEVCERFGMTWPEAEALFIQLESEQGDLIQEKRRPLLGTIGLVILIAGIALALGMAILGLAGVSIILLRIPIPFLGNILFFVIGVAMAVGGVTGLMDVFKKR